MKHPAKPTAFWRSRYRRWHKRLGLNGRGREEQNEPENISNHARVKQQTLQILSNPLSIDHETALGERVLHLRGAHFGRRKKPALHASCAHGSKPEGFGGIQYVGAGVVLRKTSRN